MRPFTLRVVEIATTSGQIHVRCGGAEALPAPGQFYLARQREPAAGIAAQPLLRIPLHLTHTHAGGLEFFVGPAHPYAALEPGDELDLIGPCGRGFHLPPRAAHLLLVADSPERLYSLAHLALERHFAVTLLLTSPLGAPLPLLPLDVEIRRGPLTPDLAAWADLVAADVPDPLALARAVRALRLNPPPGFVQALLTPPMPCGVGACRACWVEVGTSRRLACVHGPVFEM